MKLYRLSIVHPKHGVQVSWHASQKDVQRIWKEEQAAHPALTLLPDGEGIREFEMQWTKSDFICFLNRIGSSLEPQQTVKPHPQQTARK